MNKQLMLLIFLSIFGVFSCTKTKNRDSSWSNPYPGYYQGEDIKYYYVKDEAKKECIDKLNDFPFFKVGEGELSNISDIPYDGRNYYCIRALYSQKGGTYIVQANDKNEVLVYYVVLSPKKKIENKDVLVISLPNQPGTIFVSVSNTK